MPKAKPDSVQSIRIELQETERAALEASLTAGGISNVLQGIGAALLPFQGALTAFVVAFLADEIGDDAKKFLDKYAVNPIRNELTAGAQEQYQAITAYLYPLSWPIDYEAAGRFKKGPDGKKTDLPTKFMRQRFQAFMNQTQQVMFISEMQNQNKTPAEAWALFYPWDEMINEAIFTVKGSVF